MTKSRAVAALVVLIAGASGARAETKDTNTYSTVPAPPTLDATIDSMRKQFHIDAPGADLLYSRPYETVRRGG